MRRYRDTPYHDDNARSKRAKMARPKDLLAWFLTGLREETPDRLHTAGVWRDAKEQSDDDGYEPVGGSLLGSPRVADPFRTFLHDAFEKQVAEYEGHKELGKHYRTPMRAALARLNGRDSCTFAERRAGHQCEPKPLMARYLYRIACMHGDVDSAAASFGFAPSVGIIVMERALDMLYERYHEEPPVNYYHQQEGTAA